MAKIGLNITVSGFTGKLLIRWLEASSPLAEVGRSAAFNFPYDDVYSINDINPVVHIIQLWQSADGVALTQLIKAWEIDASVINEVSSVTYQYLVDRGTDVVGPPAWHDPANLDTELTDERLDGYTQDQLYVVEAGFGPKRNDEYSLKSGGGIILNSGNTFNSGTGWFITVSKLVTQQGPTTSTTNSNRFADVQEITAATDFYTDTTTNLYNKLCIINGTGVVPINFLALSLIPNFTNGTFNTHQGTQRYLKLQFNAGDTVYYMGEAKNTIYVRRGAVMSIFVKDGAAYVTGIDPDAHRVGQRLLVDKLGLNMIMLDGTQYAQSDLPGLMEFVDSLPPDQVVTETAWATSSTAADGTTVYVNKSKYARDDIGGTIRVPDDRNKAYRALKNTDGVTSDAERQSQGVGGYQNSKVGKHDHFMFNIDSINNDGSALTGSNPTQYPTKANELNGGSSYRIKGSTTVPTLGKTSPAGGASNSVDNVMSNTGLLPAVVI